MRNYRFLLVLALFLSVNLCGQQSAKVTEKFFPNPNVPHITTPGCERSVRLGSSFTTADELEAGMQECMEGMPGMMLKEQIGSSQSGAPIWMWKISASPEASEKGKEKMKLLYVARMHGDEPSGTEALLFLAQQMRKDPSVKKLLQDADFYLVPMVNVDGAVKNRRTAQNGKDLNRDLSSLMCPETYALQCLVDRIRPHVMVDLHEFRALGSKLFTLSSDTLSLPWDIMVSYGKNSILPEAMRRISAEVYEDAVMRLAKTQHWQYSYYTHSDMEGNALVFAQGGVYPNTNTAVFPLQGVLTFVVETRRSGATNQSLQRRVITSYLAALEFAKVTIERRDDVLGVLERSAKDKSDLCVRFATKKPEQVPLMFLNMVKAEYTYLDVPMRYIFDSEPKIQRPQPKNYYVLASQTLIKEQLDRQHIAYTEIKQREQMKGEAYTVTKINYLGEAKDPAKRKISQSPQMTVDVSMEEKRIELPEGTLCIPLDQPKARLIFLMLEPDGHLSYVARGMVPVAIGNELPIYRK